MRRLLAVALIGLVAVVGCGLPKDDAPREIAAQDLPEDLFGSSTTMPGGLPGRVEIDLYFVRSDGQRLQRVVRELPNSADDTVLTALLAGPLPEEVEAAQVTTAIPAGTQLVQAERREQDLVITLTSEIITTIQNPQQRNAFAQLVYTADGLRDITSVRFVVDGVVVSVLTDSGDSDQPLTVFNFDSLRPEGPS
ncbi:MAG: GerMN domain-containing protein [Actinobacteria bacterium]|nr:GerMN domain-containing protein [Actinomycetota bacterium]